MWTYNVYGIIGEQATGLEDWDPYQILNVAQGSFNTKEIKKSYRDLAKTMHPDKVSSQMSKEEASRKFQNLVKAYETLTDAAKYKNWQEYGNPDGSATSRAFEIALPSFLFKEEYKMLILGVFFILFIFHILFH